MGVWKSYNIESFGYQTVRIFFNELIKRNTLKLISPKMFFIATKVEVADEEYDRFK